MKRCSPKDMEALKATCRPLAFADENPVRCVLGGCGHWRGAAGPEGKLRCSAGMPPSQTWQCPVPDLPPRASAPRLLPNSLSLQRDAALEMRREGFLPAQDALLSECQHSWDWRSCRTASSARALPSHPAWELGVRGRGRSPWGAHQNPPREKETPPDYPDRLMISPQDIQTGTETPREPGTCFPL